MGRDYAAMGAMFGLNAYGKSKLDKHTPEMRSYNMRKANETSRNIQEHDADPTLYTRQSTKEVEAGLPGAKLVPTTRSGKTRRGRNMKVVYKTTGTGGANFIRRDTQRQSGSGTVNKWDRVVTGAPVANARCSAGHESHIAPGYLLV